VTQQVTAVQAQMVLQGGHVVHQPVAAVTAGIFRDRGISRAAQVQHDQLPVRGQAAEIAQVRRCPHRPAGHAEQRNPFPMDVVGEFGPVRGGEGRHGCDARIERTPEATQYPGGGRPARTAVTAVRGAARTRVAPRTLA
jgi:hypothetical protein